MYILHIELNHPKYDTFIESTALTLHEAFKEAIKFSGDYIRETVGATQCRVFELYRVTIFEPALDTGNIHTYNSIAEYRDGIFNKSYYHEILHHANNQYYIVNC